MNRVGEIWWAFASVIAMFSIAYKWGWAIVGAIAGIGFIAMATILGLWAAIVQRYYNYRA